MKDSKNIQTNITLPRSLHRALKLEAASKGISMAKVIRISLLNTLLKVDANIKNVIFDELLEKERKG